MVFLCVQREAQNHAPTSKSQYATPYASIRPDIHASQKAMGRERQTSLQQYLPRELYPQVGESLHYVPERENC
jgi:hypothetical protein